MPRIPEQGDVRGAAETRAAALEHTSPKDAEDIMNVLRANREKNFVQRVTNAADWPVMQNPGGSYSSHRMGSAEVGGKNIAFPTLFYDKGSNALYGPPDPVAEAMKTGEYIDFPDQAAAERFANNGYKVGMNTGLMQQMRAQPAFGSVMQRLLGR